MRYFPAIIPNDNKYDPLVAKLNEMPIHDFKKQDIKHIMCSAEIIISVNYVVLLYFRIFEIKQKYILLKCTYIIRSMTAGS